MIIAFNIPFSGLPIAFHSVIIQTQTFFEYWNKIRTISLISMSGELRKMKEKKKEKYQDSAPNTRVL